jgi:hypothetical protein
MITRRIARFESFILKPLSFLFPILAVVYLYQRAWLLGAFLLIAWFCIGVMGQSLHKNKSFAELARGGLTGEENIAPDSDISHEEAHTLAKQLIFASWLCGITAGVLLHHHDYGWFIILPTAFAVAVGVGVVFSILALPKT